MVTVWIFEFRRINQILTPLMFAKVAKEDERLADSFMREYPSDTDVKVSGFRYPYYEIVPGGKLTAQHHGGVVSIRIPAGPSNLVYLVYVSPGSTLPYKAPTYESDGQGWEVRPVIAHWYYVLALGI